jgi:hypothetical protein
MAKFGKERFPSNYQSAVGMSARQLLHDNSIELVNILKQENILQQLKQVFELGSGPARNLYYLWLENKQINLNCSDLFKEASLENMHPDIKNIINFYEGDSQNIIDTINIKNLDLFLVSDHFMHLQYEKADHIIKKLISEWKPNYIMLRELKKEYETPDHPRLYHNYDQILQTYDVLRNETSKQDSSYFIWLLKNKNV